MNHWINRRNKRVQDRFQELVDMDCWLMEWTHLTSKDLKELSFEAKKWLIEKQMNRKGTDQNGN